MVEVVEVQLLDFLCHDIRDDLLDGLCSQPVLDEAVVLEPVDDEVVAVLLALLCVDDGVALPGLLDVDDLLVLLELLYLDVLDMMLYDHVTDAPFESLDALDELADVEGVDVDCLCQPLWSRCPTLLRTILDALFQMLMWKPFFFIVMFILMIWMFFFFVIFPVTMLMMIWMLLPMVS